MKTRRRLLWTCTAPTWTTWIGWTLLCLCQQTELTLWTCQHLWVSSLRTSWTPMNCTWTGTERRRDAMRLANFFRRTYSFYARDDGFPPSVEKKLSFWALERLPEVINQLSNNLIVQHRNQFRNRCITSFEVFNCYGKTDITLDWYWHIELRVEADFFYFNLLLLHLLSSICSHVTDYFCPLNLIIPQCCIDHGNGWNSRKMFWSRLLVSEIMYKHYI